MRIREQYFGLSLSPRATQPPSATPDRKGETELFIDNLLVRIHLIIEMILVDRLCAMVV